MPRKASVPPCSTADRETLHEWSRSKTTEARLVERARIVLACLEGEPVTQIAHRLRVRPNTVMEWRNRFASEGLAGLVDRARPGKPVQYGPAFRQRVLDVLEQVPRRGRPSGMVRVSPSISRRPCMPSGASYAKKAFV